MARLLISAQLGQALHRLHDSVCGFQATTYMLTILSLGHQPIRAYAPTPCNYVRNWHDQVALCSSTTYCKQLEGTSPLHIITGTFLQSSSLRRH